MTPADLTPIDITQPLRGDAALALGALAAGVRVVTGYPGSPAPGVFAQIIAWTDAEQCHAEWAPNEKVAMELAFGASLGGSRALVVLKSVGLNIALAPLATFTLSGCHAGLVILLGDDPGSWSSQNEQDTRWLARLAELPIVEPTSVEQAASLMAQAYVWSEALGLPVIVRVTPALTSARGVVEPPWELPPAVGRYYRRRNRWVVLPASVVAQHRRLHRLLRQMQQMLEASPYDVSAGEGRLGVIACGGLAIKLKAVWGQAPAGVRLLTLASSWPLPEDSLASWLQQVERALVLEDGGPFVEGLLRGLAQRRGLGARILGREDHSVAEEGELREAEIGQALGKLSAALRPAQQAGAAPAMPSRVPLCEGCPYIPTFEALLRAMERHGGRQRHLVIGETGCMVRANLPPMELFDVKYSLGSGLGIGLGLALREARQRVVALLGDSSFFHTDLNAMPYAALLKLPMTVIVLDNGATALTGGQAHPGSALDERGRPRVASDLMDVIRGCGAEPRLLAAADPAAMEAAFDEALGAEALRVFVVRGPCPKYVHATEV